ncbi:MAG TPA: hypothetical protein VF824_20060 [Thermoanaerobaculia bacterium]
MAPVAAARDRAVFVYPRERAWFRRLFYTRHQKELKERVARQYDVDVHEQVATDDALFNIDVRGATVLVITGHGDPFSMYLSGRHRRTLDWTDRARLVAFFSKLDPNATIVLQSCNTAHGFARLIKDAAGPTRRVIAASGAVPRDGLEITSLLPFDVTIHCDDAGRSWDCTFRLP